MTARNSWFIRRSAAFSISLVLVASHAPPTTLLAASHPHLVSPATALESAWSHDTSVLKNRKYCVIGGTRVKAANDECNYHAGSIYVGAIFSAGQVWTYRLPAYDPSDGWGNRSPRSSRYWSFLVSLLPPGAKRYACKMVASSDQGGPARTCLYHYRFKGGLKGGGDTLVVAQYLSPSEGGDNGVVEPDEFHLGFGAVHS